MILIIIGSVLAWFLCGYLGGGFLKRAYLSGVGMDWRSSDELFARAAILFGPATLFMGAVAWLVTRISMSGWVSVSGWLKRSWF